MIVYIISSLDYKYVLYIIITINLALASPLFPCKYVISVYETETVSHKNI